MSENIKLMGTLTTLAPMIHIDSSGKSAAGTVQTYCMKTTMPFRNDTGELELRQIPFVQGSSYRGSMRNIMSEILAAAVKNGEDGLDLNTAMRLFSGGRMEAGVAHSLDQARDILARCIDLNLFGGIDGTMFKSNVSFDMLYPIVETTVQAKIVPSHYADLATPETAIVGDKVRSMLQQWVKQARRDEVMDADKDMMVALSTDGYKEAEAYLLEGIATQEKNADARKSGSKEKSPKTIQKHYAEIEAIPAGVNLFSSITVKDVDKVTMGLFLKTIQSFLKFPYLASSSRAGYGKVAARYDIKVGDEVIKDFITQDEFGDAVLDLKKYGQDCVDAFDAWAGTATPTTLQVVRKAPAKTKEA